jgi:hypothetical protein
VAERDEDLLKKSNIIIVQVSVSSNFLFAIDAKFKCALFDTCKNFRRHAIQHNDFKHNEVQRNDAQHHDIYNNNK